MMHPSPQTAFYATPTRPTSRLLSEGLELVAREAASHAKTIGEKSVIIARLLDEQTGSLSQFGDLISELKREAEETATLTRILERQINALKRSNSLAGAR